MALLEQAIWGHIWKRTVEKSQTNATSVIMHPLEQEVWGDIWKRTVEKSHTIATSVAMHPPVQTNWGCIWEHTVEKSKCKCNQCDYWLCDLLQTPWRDMTQWSGEKSNIKSSVWLVFIKGKNLKLSNLKLCKKAKEWSIWFYLKVKI